MTKLVILKCDLEKDDQGIFTSTTNVLYSPRPLQAT